MYLKITCAWNIMKVVPLAFMEQVLIFFNLSYIRGILLLKQLYFRHIRILRVEAISQLLIDNKCEKIYCFGVKIHCFFTSLRSYQPKQHNILECKTIANRSAEDLPKLFMKQIYGPSSVLNLKQSILAVFSQAHNKG